MVNPTSERSSEGCTTYPKSLSHFL